MKYTLSALTFIAACLTVGTATARTAPLQECETSAECPESYECVLDSIEACPDCISDEECPPCGTHTFGYCEPPPPAQCASDADCEGNDVCVSYTYGSCSGSSGVDPDCTGDEPCGRPEPLPEECEEVTEAYCVPSYYAPCQIDSDCGNGFTCEDLQVCSCSSGTREDGDQEAPTPDCECGPTGEKYCELIYVNCEDDGDCASGLECFSDYGTGTTTDDPAPPGEPESMDGDGDVGVLPEPEESAFCAPAGYWGSPSTGGFVSPVGDAEGAERLSWGESGGENGGAKGGGGCTSAEGNASLGIFGLFALIALRLRR